MPRDIPKIRLKKKRIDSDSKLRNVLLYQCQRILCIRGQLRMMDLTVAGADRLLVPKSEIKEVQQQRVTVLYVADFRATQHLVVDVSD